MRRDAKNKIAELLSLKEYPFILNELNPKIIFNTSSDLEHCSVLF